MAELVGEAYVRVHADTKFMERAIQRDMSKIGKKGADSLVANFDKTLKAAATGRLKQSQRMLAESIVGADFTAMLRRSGKNLDDFVNDIADSMDEMAAHGKIKFKQLEDAADSLSDWAERTRISDEFDQAWSAADRLNKVVDENVKSAERLAARYERLDTQALRHDIAQLNAEFVAQQKAIDDAHLSAQQYEKELKKDAGTVRDVTRSFAWLRKETSRIEEDMRRISLSGGLGAVFGRGSRNNFLNFVGSVAYNFSRLGETLLRFPVSVISTIVEQGGQLTDKFKAMHAAGASIPSIIGTGLAGAAAIGGPALLALAAAAASLAVVLPVLASAASLALGGITAIAGALVFAAAGAILPLVPAVAALGAGLAVVVAGIAELSANATAADKAAMRPMVATFKELREAAQPILHEVAHEVGRWSTTFKEVIPFLEDMGESALTAFRYFREGVQSPEMDEFFKAWGESLPRIFEDLSMGVTHLFRGLTAFFAPILPYAERLASLFEDAMITFDLWARSTGGQNSISEFMEKAWHAADLLFESIGNVTEALADVFNIGQDAAGGSFLQWLVDVTAKFAEFTSSPEGQDQIRQWFEDAKEAGATFMRIVGDIGAAFDRLDSPEGRQMLQDFLSFVTTITAYGTTVATGIGYMSTAFTQATLLGALMGEGFNNFVTFMREVWEGFTGDLQRYGQALVAPFQWAWDVLFGNSIIPDIINGFSSWIPRIPAIIDGALAGVDALMTDPFGTARSVLIGILNLLPGDVGTRLASAVGRIGPALAGVPSALSSRFSEGRTAIGSTLSSIAADISSRVSGWAATARSAVSGIPDALGGAFATARDRISAIIDEIAGFVARIPGMQRAAESARGLLAGILNATIDRFNRLPLPDLPRMMAGGILNTATPLAVGGEAGREAVIPLDRPLSQIDPSVREMAAMLRGRWEFPRSGGRSISIAPGAIVVNSPNADPRLVAESVMDRLVVLTAD